MKIKITENQAKRLKLISENENALTQFEKLCAAMIQDLNNIWVRVSNLSVIEIISNDVNLTEIDSRLSKIDNDLHNGDAKAYTFINNLPDEDLDIRIDNAHDKVRDKLSSLQLIIMDLEKLQLTSQEHKLSQSFADVKPMDITGIQK